MLLLSILAQVAELAETATSSPTGVLIMLTGANGAGIVVSAGLAFRAFGRVEESLRGVGSRLDRLERLQDAEVLEALKRKA